MMPSNSRLLLLGMMAAAGWLSAPARGQSADPGPAWKAALLVAPQVTKERLHALQSDGYAAVVLLLKGNSAEQSRAEVEAARQIKQTQLELGYWIEIARCPELADARPDWMASLQGHDEWRRLFPRAEMPAKGEVVKTYPWVPILSREPFEAQLQRVEQVLRRVPRATSVFLNDLQGAPSACGCGNTLCRWTTDYGPVRTTTPLEPNAAARFVSAVEQLELARDIIPVWTTECEEHDGAADGACAGVGCFRGICWKAYTAQLTPLARNRERIGVLLPVRLFERELSVYGEPGGWIRHAISTFQTMPTRHGGPTVSASRLVAVLQGWNGSPDDLSQQLKVATSAGVQGCLVALTPIDQSWQPRLFRP